MGPAHERRRCNAGGVVIQHPRKAAPLGNRPAWRSCRRRALLGVRRRRGLARIGLRRRSLATLEAGRDGLGLRAAAARTPTRGPLLSTATAAVSPAIPTITAVGALGAAIARERVALVLFLSRASRRRFWKVG